MLTGAVVCLQWGPALFLCFKRAVAKANALLFEAGAYLVSVRLT